MLPADSRLPWRFSTRGMAPDAREAALRALSERGSLPMEPLPACVVEADITARAYGNVAVLFGVLGGLRQVVSPRVQGFADEVFLGVNVAGHAVIRHRSRELALTDGDGVLFSDAEAGFVSIRTRPSRFLGVRLPRRALAPLVANLDQASMWAIPGESRSLRLLVDYVGLLARGGDSQTPALDHAVSTHILDLLALSVGADRDLAAEAGARGVRAARLQAIKADVSSRLGDPELSVLAVAARQGVTPRYVHKLFESEGSTFSEFVLARRLEFAHRLLTAPRLASRSITSIALDAGFSDLSHFNHAFRRRYGATPTETRAAESIGRLRR
ncbi:MAG: AraC family transcriptional regulator [Hyphomicrobiales bacterium]|nr:AraC family transcriptional regulator [Hyphomicrobiales bacterium]